MSIKKSILLRVRLAFLAISIFGALIVYRIFDIQVNQGEKWRSMAEKIGLKYVTVKATRGNIYSDNGSLLATSLPFYKVAFDPYLPADDVYKPGIDSLCYLLSKHFKDKTPKEYKQKIHNARLNGRRYIVLNSDKINYQDKKMMTQWPIFREGRIKGGVIFEKVNERFRPFSYLGYRTIGMVNSNNRGIVGLEYSFNRYLAGNDGEALFQKMAGGGWRPVYDGSEIRPEDGLDIVTTINVNLQDVAESALLNALMEHRADYGSVVIMEVKTGEIKAISNLSRSDNGDYYERYNYAVGSQGAREPGSTFKLASMLSLLEKSKISLSDTVDTGDGNYQFYDEVMRDHKIGGFGKITVQDVFEKSSNIGIAKLVNEEFGANPKEFVDFIKQLGLADPLGFQIVGEGKPYIKEPSDSTWSGISLPWMSHGYELKLTPLHTLTLYNAVANNGRMIQPIIVKEVVKADRRLESFKAKVLNEKIASDETLREIRMLLEGVVQRGTATNIRDSFYPIAGKTGTAKKLVNGKYTSAYYASFAGYFPANDPKYSCIVVIDDPKGSKIYGSDVAAPVFKEIADKIFSLDMELQQKSLDTRMVQGVFPVIKSGKLDELQMICNELGISNHVKDEADWVTTDISNNSIFWEANKTYGNTIPDVRGMTLRDALYLLENKGLEVDVEGTRNGRVVTQSVTPGSNTISVERIKLTLG